MPRSCPHRMRMGARAPSTRPSCSASHARWGCPTLTSGARSPRSGRPRTPRAWSLACSDRGSCACRGWCRARRSGFASSWTSSWWPDICSSRCGRGPTCCSIGRPSTGSRTSQGPVPPCRKPSTGRRPRKSRFASTLLATTRRSSRSTWSRASEATILPARSSVGWERVGA